MLIAGMMNISYRTEQLNESLKVGRFSKEDRVNDFFDCAYLAGLSGAADHIGSGWTTPLDSLYYENKCDCFERFINTSTNQ